MALSSCAPAAFLAKIMTINLHRAFARHYPQLAEKMRCEADDYHMLPTIKMMLGPQHMMDIWLNRQQFVFTPNDDEDAHKDVVCQIDVFVFDDDYGEDVLIKSVNTSDNVHEIADWIFRLQTEMSGLYLLPREPEPDHKVEAPLPPPNVSATAPKRTPKQEWKARRNQQRRWRERLRQQASQRI